MKTAPRDRTIRRLTALSWLLVVAVLALLAAGAALAVTAAASSAPQSCLIRIIDGDGTTTWWRFSGTGSGGVSPLAAGVCGHGPLLVDGADVDPSGCGSFTRPCVVLWPRSPQSP